MDIIFKCGHCKQELEVDSAAAGQQIGCPSCGQMINIPAPDATNIRMGAPTAASNASAREERHFAVPVSEKPVEPLIKKPLPSLEAAAIGKEGTRQIRIKTLRHSDCKEVGHDNFDKVATDLLQSIGEENIVSLNTFTYTFVDIGTQKLITDFGILVVYRG
jgi:hypothetical protein